MQTPELWVFSWSEALLEAKKVGVRYLLATSMGLLFESLCTASSVCMLIRSGHDHAARSHATASNLGIACMFLMRTRQLLATITKKVEKNTWSAENARIPLLSPGPLRSRVVPEILLNPFKFLSASQRIWNTTSRNPSQSP